MYRHLSKNGITNPVFLLTGHSRGAAVANLLAETLNIKYGTANVFAYTFATPNVTKNTDTARDNIYNFCFEDDFVPQVPLTEWKYGKYGTTHTRIAGEWYKYAQSFKRDMDLYIKESKGKSEVLFNLKVTVLILDYIVGRWKTVDEYYNKKEDDWRSLYDFFRTVVAPAAMGRFLDMIELLIAVYPNSYFAPIALFFLDGADTYIYNAHHAFTYYTAMKYDLFTLPQYIL